VVSSIAAMSQVEIEQLARQRAEVLLTPRERVEANTPERPAQHPPEPSIEERLAAIDRRWQMQAERDKRELAAMYLEAARKRFCAAVESTADAEVRNALKAVDRAQRASQQVIE
jgi:hypothetical protein